MTSSDFDYATNRRDQKQQLRDAIFTAASDLLSKNGLEGLSVRAIATNIGASTKVIYSHFGGKPGIVAALYDHGFTCLAEQLNAASVDTSPADDRIKQLAHAYRKFGISSPHIYELMYGPRVRELLPTRGHRNTARPAQQAIVDLFEHGQSDGTIVQGDSAHQARLLWTVMHGSVSLELTTWFDAAEGEQRLDEVVEILLASIRQPKP